jgi:hypothetical protein
MTSLNKSSGYGKCPQNVAGLRAWNNTHRFSGQLRDGQSIRGVKKKEQRHRDETFILLEKLFNLA